MENYLTVSHSTRIFMTYHDQGEKCVIFKGTARSIQVPQAEHGVT